jgi:rfaE bifunctional protein nucleotidyltransferase chain/domain
LSTFTKIERKIVYRKSLPDILQKNLPEGKKIVFTNGCFDILHPGHLHLLSSAKELGDLLIVGLNSDTSVKKLKGEKRPVMDEHSRAIVLASLECVDFVVLFSEETPLELIREVGPDILVKGGDYLPDEIVGADIVNAKGGKTVTIPLLEGFSSTKFISKF